MMEEEFEMIVQLRDRELDLEVLGKSYRVLEILREERNSCRLRVGFVRAGDRAQFGSSPDLELEMFAGKFLARIEVPAKILREV